LRLQGARPLLQKGEKQEMMNRTCPRCGFSNTPEMSFCTNCGNNLISLQSETTSPSAATGFNQIPFPQVPPKRKSKIGLYLVLAGAGLLVVLFIVGIGLLAMIGAMVDENSNSAANNSSLRGSTNFSVTDKNTSSNSRATNANSRNLSNANRSATNLNANSSRKTDETAYGALTDGMDLEDVRQTAVGKFRLARTETSDDWENALERENLIYKHANGSEVEVGVARFDSGDDAREALRNALKIFEKAGDEVSAIEQCVNRTDKKPIGLMATLTQKSIDTHRQYWTDGAFLYVVSAPADKKDLTAEWMGGSRY
jgi:hypothetical protein